ncbi:hypothetical protein F5Y10DRAFT_124407 [Nemania abortiva]|nr:hypothetical protein F5Y10DRAFT_124407 [Nemania abortiva]
MESSSPPIPKCRKRMFKLSMGGKDRLFLKTPSAGSLYSVMDQHPTLSLYTRPLQWTDMHTHLLGCRFVRLPTQNSQNPLTPPSSGSSPSSSSTPQTLTTPSTLTEVGKQLSILMSGPRSVSTKSRALRKILELLYPADLNEYKENLPLSVDVGNLRYPGAVTCQAAWFNRTPHAQSFNSGTTQAASQQNSPIGPTAMDLTVNTTPMLAYFSQSHLNHHRRTMGQFLGSPDGKFNYPGHRLGVIRAKKLLAKNSNEDAYLLAMILAMAQESARTTIWYRDFKARILSIAEEEMAFLVYTATVPTGFLAKFRDPSATPAGDSGVTIEYTKVPVYPVLGLRERLGEALGSDIVGDLDATLFNWHLDPAPSPGPVTRPKAPKRPRATLPEDVDLSRSHAQPGDIDEYRLDIQRLGEKIAKRRRLMGEDFSIR